MADRPMIVQFARALSADDITDLRRSFGLKLDQYVPARGYLERIGPETLARLQQDPRVQDCLPQDPGTVLDRSSIGRGGVSDNVPKPQGDQPIENGFRATVVDDGDPEAVAQTIASIGGRGVRVLDDRASGGSVRVHFELDDLQPLEQIAAIDDVVLVEARSPRKSDGTARTAPAPSDVMALWKQGLHGEGQVIGILDNGPPDLGHCFFADTEPNLPGPEHRKVVALRNTSGSPDGRHATFTAGCAVGDDRDHPGANDHRGSAWAARLVVGNHNDLDEPNTVFAELTAAKAAGAFIHTNSWHFDTGRPARYNQDAADVDRFTFLNEDHLVLGSAGNRGEQQGPPGTAKNAICVGAAQVGSAEVKFADGNPGPTADGRSKPELVASGCDIRSALMGTKCETGRFSILIRCATSFATPRAAATAALVRQYFTEGRHPSGSPSAQDAMTPSGALLKAVLLNSTVALADIPERPSKLAGWGLIRLDRALALGDPSRQLAVFDVRHAAGPTANQRRTHQLRVPPATAELRVTLVWTDPAPAPITATQTAVNRLRLTVTAPDGAAHVGNQTPDPVQFLALAAPAPGDWTLSVDAIAVKVGRPGQGYALVAATDAG